MKSEENKKQQNKPEEVEKKKINKLDKYSTQLIGYLSILSSQTY
jgi:hypothetical protein